MKAWRNLDNTMRFSRPESAGDDEHLYLPCGRCFGCLMDKRFEWSLRCRHEAKFWKSNLFVTLTYDDEHLPEYGSLVPRHLQSFLKRLRRRVSGVEEAPDSEKRPIRFFACGEYGDKTKRPHYHAILFNTQFEDVRPVGPSTYTSRMLSDLWPYGSHDVKPADARNISYTAGYCRKKVYGEVNRDHEYEVIDFSTGEVLARREPVFNRMSLKPGIAQYWYERFGRSDLRNGYLVVDGKRAPVPRFYQDKFKEDFPEEFNKIAWSRYENFVKQDPVEYEYEHSFDRLQVKEAVAKGRAAFYKSPYEVL